MRKERIKEHQWRSCLSSTDDLPVISPHAISYARLSMDRHKQAARRVTLLLATLCCLVVLFVVQLFI